MRYTWFTLALLLPASLIAETHEVVADTYYRTFSKTHAVLRQIKPGEVVRTKTIDSSGHDEKGIRRHPEGGNPLTGPFLIEGAEPGDAILVHLRKLRMNRNFGYSSYRLGLFSLTPESIETLFPAKYKEDVVVKGRSNMVPWDLDLARNTVRLREPNSSVMKMEFPAKPMLGCIGVAAPGDFAPTSTPAGSYGGNLDYNQIREGATVMLPVYHPGALLFVGDGHALQGDGEPTGNGIETSLNVEFSVEIRKKANLTGPRVETGEYIISVGAQPEFVSALDRALQTATVDMVRWLTEEYRLEPWAAHVLVAFQGKYDVATVAGSMGLKIPKQYLPGKEK
jgi:acetamidase/formamidase